MAASPVRRPTSSASNAWIRLEIATAGTAGEHSCVRCNSSEAPRLQEDDRACAGVGPRGEKLDGSAAGQWEALDEDILMCADEVTVVSRIEKQQYEMVGTAVPQLQREATLQRLTIAWSRLGLDADIPVVAGHDSIPGSSVCWAGERHFGPEPQRTMKMCPEPAEERNVSGIPQRLTGWERSNAQLETHDCQQPRSLLDRQIARQSSLNAAVLRLRQSDGLRHHCAAEPSVKPSVVELVKEPARERPAASRRDVERPGPAAHDASLPAWPYASVIEAEGPSAPA